MNTNNNESMNQESIMEVFKHDNQFSKFNALNVIQAQTNPNWIKKKGKGKNALDYVSGDTVTRMLNKAFNYKWSFYIKETRLVPSIDKPAWKDGDPAEPQPPVAQVLGSLVVPGWGVREQWGSQPLRGGADVQEHALKGAATDSMKKCASMFGIALDLYGQDGMTELMVTPQDFLANDEESIARMKNQAAMPKPTADKKEETVEKEVQAEPITQPQPAAQTALEVSTQPAQKESLSLEERIEQYGQEKQTPVEQQITPEPKTKASARHWAPEDIEGLKKEKARLGIELSNNDGLNPYAQEFFGNPEATYYMITPTNAKDFLMFLSRKQPE